MRRLLAFLMCLLLTSSLGLSAAAHAQEAVSCAGSSLAGSGVHAEGDGDEMPADSGKGYPHHHGGCHGHHVGVPVTSEPTRHSLDQHLRIVPRKHPQGAGFVSAPALRPPQA